MEYRILPHGREQISVIGLGSGSITGTEQEMVTGPATKITNLGAVKIVLGLKRFLLYLAYVIIFALFTGWVVNLAT